MKKFLFFLLAITILSCGNKEKIEYNKTVIDEEESVKMLIGKANKEGFNQEPFKEWYDENYNEYEVNDSLAQLIKSEIKGKNLTLFMGTWCSDSQREIPHIYKILEHINFNFSNLELITLNREKVTPDNLQEGYNITNVPTLIVYKNGKELNRIVEYPIETLEADLLKILKEEDYKHAYFE